MIEKLRILQAVRLKGRVKAEDLAAAAGLRLADAGPLLNELASAGLVEETRERVKLTAEGRAALEQLLAEERSGTDVEAVVEGYHEFDVHNNALKELMTRWQLKDANTPNDHGDAAYDQAVIDDLVVLDARFEPLLDRFIQLAPRLGHYPARFKAALERMAAGDRTWFARPLADSYHTIWFELHEDLIGLAGLSRAEEAAAGRAL